MTRITMVDPHNIKPSKSGAERVGLAVVFDDQFDDAVRLPQNPRHLPTRIISIAEMNEIESTGQKSLFRPALGLLEKATRWLLVAGLPGFIVYIAIGFIE